MVGSAWNSLFGCSHRHLTRPITPVSKAGVPHGDTYVVCLDCAKQFAYDLKEMRIGKPIERSNDASVLHPEATITVKRKLKYALWISVPVALLAGIIAIPRKKHEPNQTAAK